MRRGRMMRQVLPLALVPAAALAGCAVQDGGNGEVAATAPSAPAAVHGPAAPRTGSSIAAMADQYARPRAGPVAAAGASAWVKPAPAPAFVATGPLPQADPPAPPPAAVANRQPSRPAAPASDIVRPEAAAPEAPQPAAVPDPAARARGLALFGQYSCSACHVLADAGASGVVGPSLDRNPNLTRDAVATVIEQGRGAMPSFGGQMSDEEIAALADYIVGFARK